MILIRGRRFSLGILILVYLASVLPANAQTDSSTDRDSHGISGFLHRWDERALQAQANQPNWLTPVVTSTARLKQEVRYDLAWQWNPHGTMTDNYGGGRGFTTMPFSRVEVSVNLPPYIVHSGSAQRDGFGDFSVLTKFRILAANRKNGDYGLTAFLSTSFPTGSYKNGAPHPVITPTIAGGKGFSSLVYQATFGADLPSSQTSLLGRRLILNNAIQYRGWGRIWPQFEVNSNFFREGPNDGKKQIFFTPGIDAGRFILYKHLQLSLASGVQFAMTHFHTYSHQAIFTMRLPF
jgi:hypothetical protein